MDRPSRQARPALRGQRLRWPLAAAAIAALSLAGWLALAILARWILGA